MIQDTRRNGRQKCRPHRGRRTTDPLTARRHHLQPLSRTVSASNNGKASKPRCACASRHGGRALCAIPLASADGSARALGARFTCGSPRARDAPCAAASSPRQRKSRAGASDSAASSNDFAVAGGMRGPDTRGDGDGFVTGADRGKGVGCDAGAACRDTGTTRGADCAGSKFTKNSTSCCRGAGTGRSLAPRHNHATANACNTHTTATAHQAIPRGRGADLGVLNTTENITAALANASVKPVILQAANR